MTTRPNRGDENAWGAPPTAPRPARPSGPVEQPQGWAQPQVPAYGEPPGQARQPQHGQQPQAQAQVPAYGEPPRQVRQPQYGQQQHYGQQPSYGQYPAHRQQQSGGYGGYAAHAHFATSSDTERQNAEAQRQYYLKHEAAIRRVGAIFLLFAVVFGSLMAWVLTLIPDALERGPLDAVLGSGIALMVAGLAFAAWLASLGLRLRRLDPGVHATAITTSKTLVFMGLFGGIALLPVGAYAWYVLNNDKTDYVLSEPYARVRALTSDVTRPTKVVPVVVGILLAVVVLILLDVL